MGASVVDSCAWKGYLPACFLRGVDCSDMGFGSKRVVGLELNAQQSQASNGVVAFPTLGLQNLEIVRVVERSQKVTW